MARPHASHMFTRYAQQRAASARQKITEGRGAREVLHPLKRQIRTPWPPKVHNDVPLEHPRSLAAHGGHDWRLGSYLAERELLSVCTLVALGLYWEAAGPGVTKNQ
jgi:hypothetical protein